MPDSPTIVFVHGAFADGASWSPVARQLIDAGYAVRVPPNELRSLAGDAAYIRSFVEQIGGPVVLVGHSYGGAVITVAGAADNVVGLVYVAAYVLEEGESLGELQGGFPDSDLGAHLVYSPYPVDGGEPGTDVSIQIDAFPEVFADGVDPASAGLLAVSQRPLAAVAFGEPASVAAWKTTPSFGIVAAGDRAINPEVERFGYKRAGIESPLELDGPHAIMLTHPTEVAQFIIDAVG